MTSKPRYQNLKDHIVSGIRDKVWDEHTKVPSEYSLCQLPAGISNLYPDTDNRTCVIQHQTGQQLVQNRLNLAQGQGWSQASAAAGRHGWGQGWSRPAGGYMR